MVLALPVVESTPTAKNPRLMQGLCKCEECMPILGQELKKVKTVSAPKRIMKKKMKQKKTVQPELSMPLANILFTMRENQAPGSNGILNEGHIRIVFGKSRIRDGRETKIHPPSRGSKIPNISHNTKASLVFFGSSTDFQAKTVEEEMEKVVNKTKRKQKKTVKSGFSLSTSNRFSTLNPIITGL